MKKINYIFQLILIFFILLISAKIFGQNLENLADYNYNAENIVSSDSLVSELVEINNSYENLQQFIGSKKPKIIYDDYRINNYNKLEFDGIDDRLTTNFASIYQNFTFFLVVKSNESRQQTFIDAINSPPRAYLFYQLSSQKFIFRATNPIYAYQASPGQFDFSIFQISFYEENSILKKNNVEIASGNTGLNSLSGVSLGSSFNGAAPFKGDFVQLLIFTDSITTEFSDSISNYLMDKYAPAVDLGPNIVMSYGFCDTTLSSPHYYTSYLWSNGSTDSTIVINEPGLYWLEGVDIFGRSSRDTIEVIRPPYNEIQIQNSLVCFNDPDTISANLPQGNYTFEQWNDGSTNPIRILNQNESLSYSVSDSSGCLRTSNTATIAIDNSLEHISLGIDTNLCSGNSIELIQTSNNIINWLWNTQDTTASIEVNSSSIYNLQVLNSNGCQNSDTIEVTIIGDAPDLSYSIPSEICQGSELNFTENSTVPPGNTISQVVWDFGDLDSSFNSNGSHIYVDSGAFNASLQVSTLEGCSSQDEFTITVHPKPIISFTTEKYCPYEEIEFSASNEYDIPLFFYNWEFGQNASSSTDVYPSYTYGTNGNYDVQLIAVDTNNCIDTVIQNVFIQPAPVAEISVSNPCELAPLEIIDNCSIADTFSIVTYSWNYGDNTVAINPSEEKIYESYGEYNVQLFLEANNGCVDTLEQLITVHPKPVLGYDVGPACKNTWTSLENISTIPEGTLTETNWLINLQYNFNQQNTAFKFPTLGIQLVNLESMSDQGCISDTTFEIDVQNEISADYTVNPMNLTSGTPIQFINESLGADSSFWDFGDGNGFQYNQNQINEITYDQSLNGSNIDVALIITNNIGCRDTSSYTYEIKEAFLDLALQTLFVQDINGYLTVGVELSNLGSVMIENADLYLKSAENGSILENWTGQLAQNESQIYIFNAHPPSYSSTQDDTERFICVEGNVNNSGYFDVDVSNNIICKNIEGSGLVVLPIYPNPTDDDITVSILLTESSPLRVELVDQSGRLILNQDYTENLDSGIHKIVLPFSSLQKGIYHLRVSDSSTTLLEKIVRY